MERDALNEGRALQDSDGLVPEGASASEVVRKFENCEYGLEEFTHARHLTVGCWYLSNCAREEALARMRAGLQRFIAHHGKDGYHETITRFWMELLDSYLRSLPVGMPLDKKVTAAITRYGRKDVLFAYYTRERVMSETARRQWVEPNLRRIDQGVGGSAEFEQILDSL